MSAERPSAPGRVHPLARPFQRLSGPRTGLIVLAAFGAILLASFGLEALMAGPEGWAKYPDAIGVYELVPGLALAAAALASWIVRRLVSAPAGYYERGDAPEPSAHAEADAVLTPVETGKTRSAARV